MKKRRTAAEALALDEQGPQKRAFRNRKGNNQTNEVRSRVMESPRKKKKAIKVVKKGMENAPKPENFLPPKAQTFSWLPERSIIGHNKAFSEDPFPKKNFSEMKVGNWVYVPFSMDGEVGNYVYLGQVIHIEESGVRVHFTDASMENEVGGDEEFWTDFPPSHCGFVVDKDGGTDDGKGEERQLGKRDDYKNT